MEVKKSKVTEKKALNRQMVTHPETGAPYEIPEKDQYGKYTFDLKFENGDKGLWRVTDKNIKYFTIGEENLYTIEQAISNKGNKYNKIKIPPRDAEQQPTQEKQQAGFPPDLKREYKMKAVIEAYHIASRALVADKIPEGSKLADMAQLLTESMWLKLDKV